MSDQDYSTDVREALDEAWRKVNEARDLVVFATDLIENTSLRDQMGRVIKELRAAQFVYMRLVNKWDAVPEMQAARRRVDTEASRPIEKETSNAKE